jgi:reverse gyrase
MMNWKKNKRNYIIYDNDDNILADCSTIDSLYEYVESERLKLISENYSYEMKPDMTEEERLKIIKNLFEK